MFIKVTDSQSAEQFKKESPNGYWVVLYYADWCHYCQMMKPEWQKFAEKYKTNSNINIAELESKYIDMVGPTHRSNIQGFPTIVSLTKGQKQADFTGNRTSQELDTFAKTQYNNIKGTIKSSSNLNKILRTAFKEKVVKPKRKYTPRKKTSTKTKTKSKTKRHTKRKVAKRG